MLKNGERPLNREEQEFFRGLYQDHYKALFICAYQLGIGKEAAEDYVQDVFTVAIRRIEDIKKCSNPRGYLKQTLKNVIGHQLRTLRYAVNLQKKLQEDYDHGQDGQYTDELRLETLYGGTISEEELNLLIRFYLDGWSQKELAEEMGISENACKKRIRRAKINLQHALEAAKPPGSHDPTFTGGSSTERRTEQK